MSYRKVTKQRMSRIVALLLLTHTAAWASSDTNIVAMSGRILDAKTEQPLVAQVKYRLLPIANTTGIRHFDNQDGSYQLPLQTNRQYQLEVVSKDYVTLQVVIETDGQPQLPKDLLLQPLPQPGELIYLPQPILFDRGKTTPNAASADVVKQLKALLDAYPKMKIQLEGHTDEGQSVRLMELSEERAETVKEQLKEMGISRKRIKTQAFGYSKRVTKADDLEARQQNRRVEARVLEY